MAVQQIILDNPHNPHIIKTLEDLQICWRCRVLEDVRYELVQLRRI